MITRISIIIYLFFSLSSCVKTVPTFTNKNSSSPSIITYSKPEIKKKVKTGFKIPAYLIGTTIGLGIGAIAGAYFENNILYAAPGGLVGIVSVQNRIKKKQSTIESNDSNLRNIWWPLMQKKNPELIGYTLFTHNNRSLIKDDVLIVIRTSEFSSISQKLISDENEFDRQKYSSSSMSFGDWLKVAVVAYVGYKVVKEAFNSNSSSNIESSSTDIEPSPESNCNCKVSFNSITTENNSKKIKYNLDGCGYSGNIGYIIKENYQYKVFNSYYDNQDDAISALTKGKGCADWEWK